MGDSVGSRTGYIVSRHIRALCLWLWRIPTSSRHYADQDRFRSSMGTTEQIRQLGRNLECHDRARTRLCCWTQFQPSAQQRRCKQRILCLRLQAAEVISRYAVGTVCDVLDAVFAGCGQWPCSHLQPLSADWGRLDKNCNVQDTSVMAKPHHFVRPMLHHFVRWCSVQDNKMAHSRW